MTERPTDNVIEFRELPHQNHFFTRAYWIFDAIYNLTEEQAMRLKELDAFKVEWIELADGNEIVTLKILEDSELKGARPSKIYKIPEYTEGREYLKQKNQPDLVGGVSTTWVELIDPETHKEFNEILYNIEEALDFGSAEVTNIDQGFVRTKVMNPHISKTIRSMVGLSRQKVINTAAEK